jgi:hypothetical protein
MENLKQILEKVQVLVTKLKKYLGSSQAQQGVLIAAQEYLEVYK